MSVIYGPELRAVIAANLAAVNQGFVTIQGGTYRPTAELTQHFDTFQMGRTPVTNAMYDDYLKRVGPYRHSLIATSPNGASWLLALGGNADEVRWFATKTHPSKLFPCSVADALKMGGMKVYMGTVSTDDHPKERGFDRPRQPVVNVDWLDAVMYAFSR